MKYQTVDAKKIICLILVTLSSIAVYGGCPFAKYTDVVTACTGANDLGIVYPAGTSGKEVESFPLRPKQQGKGYTHGIGCMDESPSPAWYAIKIDEPGDLLMTISHSAVGADIDFVCWGPLSGDSKQAMLENICRQSDTYFADCEVLNETNVCRQTQLDQCESKFAVGPNASKIEQMESRVKISDCKMEVERRVKTDPSYECFYGNQDAFPIGYMADCSFSSNESENCYIPNAKRGDWYLILVTNFYGIPGDIKFTQIEGSATTDCNVIVDAGSNSPVCEGTPINLFVNNVPAYASCKWTGPNGFESSEISPTIPSANMSNAGTYYVQIVTHDGLKSDEVPVKVDLVPNATVDTIVRVVEGDEIDFYGTKLSKEGNYKVNVSNGQCDKIFNVTVVEMPLLPAFIEYNSPICYGDSLVLSIGDAPTTGVTGYEWRGPNGFRSISESPILTKMNENKAGSYSLRIKKDGLSYPVAPVNVDVMPRIKNKITQRIPYGESFEFDGETISKRGIYTANLKSEAGCDSVVELYLIPELPDLVPDVLFTPNGDGENDLWLIKNIDLSPEAVVRVFDRFGKKVYEGTNYSMDNAWDGRDINGNVLPSTDYWYSIDVQSADKVYYGHVTLLR